MLKSMTAFARASRQTDEAEITWELRSVNHRYLEINMRIPDELKALEMKLRELIQQQLGRGKVECSLKLNRQQKQVSGITLNLEMVQSVLDACNQIDMQMGQGVAPNALAILQYPGVVVEQRLQLDTLQQSILDCLLDALNDLQQSRSREGTRLQELLEERAAAISSLVTQVKQRRPQVNDAVRQKLVRRLQDISVEFDASRMETEIALILQKMDVDEELDRLEAHTDELQAVFQRDEPVGRRLDFLMQEFNREANTLGSKSSDIETTQAAVELKVLIEQMREQVQNIE